MDEWWPKIEQAFLERGWSRLEQHAQKAAKKKIISTALESLLRAEATYQGLCWTDPNAIPILSPAEQLKGAFRLLEEAEGERDAGEWAKLLRFKFWAATQQWSNILAHEQPDLLLRLDSISNALEFSLVIQAIFAMALAAEHCLGQKRAIEGFGAIVACYRRHLIAADDVLSTLMAPTNAPFIHASLLAYARLNVRCKGIGSLTEQRERWFDAAMALRLLLNLGKGTEEAFALYLQCLEARFPQSAEYRSSFEIIPITSATASSLQHFNLTFNQSTQSLRFQAPGSVASLVDNPSDTPFTPNGPEEDFLLCSALLDTLQPIIGHDRQTVHANPNAHLKQWIRRLAMLPQSKGQSLLARLALSLPERGAVACQTLGTIILTLDAEDSPVHYPWIVSLAQDYAAMGGLESEIWLAWARVVVKLKDPQAIEHYLKCDGGLAWGRAMVLHAAGRCEEACTLLSEVLSVDPDHVEARWLRGQCEMEMGRLAQAEDDLQSCLLVDGGAYTPAWLSIVELRAIGGRWSDWRDALEIAEGEAGMEELWPFRVALLRKLGMLPEALALCRAALRLAYGVVEGEESEHLGLSLDNSTLTASETTANPDFITRFLGPFLVAPEPFTVESSLAVMLNDRVIELMAERDKGARTAVWWTEAASLLLSLDRASDAHRCLKQAQALHPQSPLIPTVKAKLAARKGSLAESIDIARNSSNSCLLIERLMADGDLMEAEVRAREACGVLYPKDPQVWHLLGRLLMERGDWREARDTLERAMELEQTVTCI